MLKALLWYLGSGWANLVRVFRPGYDRKVYYFAFGANLDVSVLSQRKTAVFDSFDHVLHDARLQFTQPGFYHNHGYASADHSPGDRVYGRVYQILQTDARRMDYFEGEAFLRVHEKVYDEVEGKQFYYYRTTRLVDGLKPTQEYLDYLMNAYAAMEIVPSDYIQAMKATEVLTEFKPMTTTSIFIGNLDAWPRLLQPLLLSYEKALQHFIEFTWHRSLVDWMIKWPVDGDARGQQ